MLINSYGNEIPRPRMTTHRAKPVEKKVSFIFRYRPLGMLIKFFYIQNLLLFDIEMLLANDIAPRYPELIEHSVAISKTSSLSGRGEHSKVKKEAESESETDDEDSIREKALLVRTLF